MKQQINTFLLPNLGGRNKEFIPYFELLKTYGKYIEGESACIPSNIQIGKMETFKFDAILQKINSKGYQLAYFDLKTEENDKSKEDL